MRLPIYLLDAAGAVVTGATITGAEIRVSNDGGDTFANGTGTVHEVANGVYYYDVPTAEEIAPGIVILVEKAGARAYTFTEDVPPRADFAQSEATALERRTAVFLVDASGAGVAGLTGWSGAEIQISKNGAAFVNAAGTMSPGEQGVYSYEATAAELDTIGLWILKVNKATARQFVYAAVIAKSSTLRISNITPIDGLVTPGTAGAFSATFRTARLTPIEFDLAGLTTGEQISISVSFADRNEVYVARDAEGLRAWPFDLAESNTIGDQTVEPCHVAILPRGGWPPCVVEIKVASAMMAAE